MIKTPSWSSREESILLLNAYLDNELDAASVLDVERRLAADPALKAEHDRLKQLQSALASQLAREQASEDLKRRITEIVDPPPVVAKPFRPSPRTAYGWPQLAAAAALAAVVAGAGVFGLLRPDPLSNDIAAIVADHRRALLAAAPYDVASSDQHTVKPWFDSKLALSPQVLDLATWGYPLAGGRVEILNGKPVPVLVYKRRAHVISVVAAPRDGEKSVATSVRPATRDGYSVITWQSRDFDYFAVSDVAESELSDFVARWREVSGDR
ncbi:anti-sigma factor [Hyphomicrobium sp.]|uniref:anti-sigma factor family protein n=1 Tax=Hyphomicrobium sp. TaxID=82 RepID=UPI002E3699D8|nr:anti-sigma factor [Hyphomicrobium sp.]HEX2842176.1 anti-sigma factor [Hyphomicrobium sp.]